jgi:flavodoxin
MSTNKESKLKLVGKRKPISPKLRFEVFKRDNHKCQYCGATPKDEGVVLEVDHILPVYEGGDNSFENLITSCKQCNIGKGKRKITDKNYIFLKEKELKETDEKREQLKAYLKSRLDKTEEIKPLIDYINHIIEINTGFKITVADHVVKEFLNLYKKLDMQEFVEVIEDTDFPDILFSQTGITKEKKAAHNAGSFIFNIKNNLKKFIKKKKQGVVSLSGYLRGILKNRTIGWEDVWEIRTDINNILRPISAREDKIKILQEKLIPLAKEIPQNNEYSQCYLQLEQICKTTTEFKRF